MLHRARSLVTVLALAASPAAIADSSFYHQNKYTFCDAKMLSGLWRQSMGETKQRIGRKLDAGGASLKYLDDEIGRAKEHARKNAASRCDFTDIGLTFDDIQKVAKAWQQSPREIKTLVENKILDVDEATTRELIKSTAQQGGGGDGLSAFLQQDRYQYCDAKLIGALWKQSIEDGKSWIGTKLLAKETDLIESKLVSARAAARKHAENRCTFDETGFDYNDAAKLAKLWNVDVGKSKAMIAQKVTDGHRADVQSALRRATPR